MASSTNGSLTPIPAPEVVAMYLYTNKAGKPSLQSQMGLDENRNELEAMTAATREAAMQHFDLRPSTFREQQPEVLQIVKEQVTKECGGLERYEDGWPVSRYIRIYLKNLHAKKGQYLKKRPAKKPMGSTSPLVLKDVAATKSELASVSKTSRPGPSRDSAGFGLQHAIGEASLPQEKMSKRSISGTRRAPQYNSSNSFASTLTPLASMSGPTSGHASPEIEYYTSLGSKDSGRSITHGFLASLRIPKPDADRISELFEAMGVYTQDYLELFATMETRDEWLRELVGAGELTPIQMRLLREGLDRVKREV